MSTVTIRPEEQRDHERIAAVVRAAFESPAEARLVAAIRESVHYLPELALVAERDGVVVGHVMISTTDLVDGDEQRRIAMLSPLAVHPDHQRRGIGATLVRAVTALADQRGEPLVVLEGSPTYYGRLGFEPAASHGLTLPLPSWAPPEAAQVIRLSNDDPTIRGTVIYPSAFHAVHDQ